MYKRIALCILGMVFVSFGIAFSAKASLGTSPISAIPYTLSLCCPVLTLGNWTILFSALLIASQAFIQGRNARKADLIAQCVLTLFFGYVIDAAMFCLQAFDPEAYAMQIAATIIGCVLIAFGVCLAIIANVTMLPGDAFVKTVAQALGREFGTMRMISDVSMTACAVLISLVMTASIMGVREGTIIAALLTGNIVKFFMMLLRDRSTAPAHSAQPKEKA